MCNRDLNLPSRKKGSDDLRLCAHVIINPFKLDLLSGNINNSTTLCQMRCILVGKIMEILKVKIWRKKTDVSNYKTLILPFCPFLRSLLSKLCNYLFNATNNKGEKIEIKNCF